MAFGKHLREVWHSGRRTRRGTPARRSAFTARQQPKDLPMKGIAAWLIGIPIPIIIILYLVDVF